VLYGCDGAWWKARDGVPGFAGLKLSQDSAACARFHDVHHVRLAEPDPGITVAEPGVIGGGGNSGFQALNLAVQFGAREIVLVGFDMHVGAGVHWHGRHGPGLNNPDAHNTARWRATLDAQAGRLADLGIRVINASPNSALTAFPKTPLEDALR
jgi:hypothetical protein